MENARHKPTAVKAVEAIIFNIRWVLPVFYIGLVVILGLYGITYTEELIHIARESSTKHIDDMKVIALDSIDVVMIANLIKMIIAGSYNSFISKDHGRTGENISSGMLKIKIATSVIVVCMIGLLKQFVVYEVNMDRLEAQLMIFAGMLIGASVLGFLEYLHIKGEQIESQSPHH